MPLALADTEPDAWGRRIIERAYRKSGMHSGLLDASDYLAGVDDASRIGALRFAQRGHLPAENRFGARRTPTLLDLSQIAAASRRMELERETLEDLQYLQGKGTSLGGARPKCSVLDENARLCIGKFPSVSDQRSVEKGEVLALSLAARAGIRAAKAHVHDVDGISVAVIERFDREQETGHRIAYWSMATFLGQDGAEDSLSYLDLAEALVSAGGADWKETSVEMLKRLFLNVLINNTDDHARNTGLLQQPNGLWVLAPMFDVNPEPLKRPDEPYESKTWLTAEEGPVTDAAQILSCAGRFGLTRPEALKALSDVLAALQGWRRTAMQRNVGMNAHDIRAYESAFVHERLEKAISLVS